MRSPNPGTHQACRSLLQKAIRRGYSTLARSVAIHLDEVGDRAWLRMRSAVIVCEECWPMVYRLDSAASSGAILELIDELARTVKNKDAAGLGSLAYAHSRGDMSVLIGSESDEYIVCLSDAVKHPSGFWMRALAESERDTQKTQTIEALHRAYRRGGWPWDRAFIQTAAFWVLTGSPVRITEVNESTGTFPYWAALDKHTALGKEVLRHVASTLKVSPQKLAWTSFYLESARVNQASESSWWAREQQWRLSRVKLDLTEAK